ncbi:MAG: hypothetical protein ABI873_00265 [Marmoricola sp.]
MSARASLTAAVVLGVLAGLGALALVSVGASDQPATGCPRPAATPARSEVLDALHDWDRLRARAWAAGDLAALHRLYVSGSVAGRADARLLGSYVARGLVVRRMTMQVLSAQVLESDEARIRVVVTDRLAAGVAVVDGHEIPLPGDAASTRLLVLDKTGGDWRVASVSARR